MKGEVVYLYAYDIAYDIDLARANAGLERAEFRELTPSKTLPRDYPFYKPLGISKDPVKVETSLGELTVRREAKLFSIGGLSVMLRVEFDVPGLGDLLRYHNPALEDGGRLDDVAGAFAEEVLQAVRPFAERPAAGRGHPEAYTVFCLREPALFQQGRTAEQWLEEWRDEVAGLLTEEADFDLLSDAEVRETTRCSFSYTNDDLLVIDWDAALALDPSGRFDNALYILETANLQLTELQIYDAMLDRTLDGAYDDLELYARRPPLLKGPGEMLTRLRTVLVDLTKFSDELTNITKFFGDYHLGRVYMGCRERFHLTEWESQLEGKLERVDGIYRRLSEDQNNRRMIVLEVAIILLFVIDL
ncbi:MAG: hypothetical protein KGL53_15650, partial [Elusimicrobia bacterium]|nr:hypothetical protein [Elusimicrobiota bacterium]